MALTYHDDHVLEIAQLALTVGPAAWTYAEQNSAAIDAHWQRESTANPNYFNGGIYLIDQFEVDEGARRIDARLLQTDFKSYLYWRDHGYPPADVLDGFGSGLIRSAEGTVILGRQRPGNINSGLTYLPGGFIDGRDVDAGGSIDIAKSVVREIEEETGLTAGELTRQEGFLIVLGGAHVAFAVPFVSHLSTAAITDRIACHIGTEKNPELAEAVAIRTPEDFGALAMPRYARTLLTCLLA